MAVEALKNKLMRKIVLVRPAVEAGESLGYLPGDLYAKINPYLRPLLDAIQEMIDYDGPFILDVLVEKHENCFPMIPSGKPHNEMLLSPETEAFSGGAALV